MLWCAGGQAINAETLEQASQEVDYPLPPQSVRTRPRAPSACLLRCRCSAAISGRCCMQYCLPLACCQLAGSNQRG